MYKECRYIRPGGYKCKAAALKGKVFCYYHTLSRRPLNKGIEETGMLFLPSVEDAAGVTIAINQVLRQFGKGNLDRHDAGTYFHGLQIAASLVRKTSIDQHPGDTVREVVEDPIRGPIAPESTGCDPEDCNECAKRFHCKKTDFKETDAEHALRLNRMAYGHRSDS